VMPLEALWWSEDPRGFSMADKSSWLWTAMIMQPDPVTSEHVAAAREQAKNKKPLPGLSRLRFERFHEGLSAQILHIGPYSEEGPTLEKLHSFIRGHGREPRGKHHEIYLSDPRRAAPEKWKTIIRQGCG